MWIGRSTQLSGQSEVLGRLCDDGCAAPTDRPYVVDGVAVWVTPLQNLDLASLAGVTSAANHLRSQVASAYFADERESAGSLLYAAGLRMPAWCRGAFPSVEPEGVAVAVLGWNGSAVTLLDGWTARRELMEASPRRYWDGLMELRPWSVFMAQVLQFQCQLADAQFGPGVPGLVATASAHGEDELGEVWTLADELAATLSRSTAERGKAFPRETDQRLRVLRKLQATAKAAGLSSQQSASPVLGRALREPAACRVPPGDLDHGGRASPGAADLDGSGGRPPGLRRTT